MMTGSGAQIAAEPLSKDVSSRPALQRLPIYGNRGESSLLKVVINPTSRPTPCSWPPLTPILQGLNFCLPPVDMPVVDGSGEAPGEVGASPLPHNSERTAIIVCAVICVALAAVFVGLRVLTRTKIVKVLGWSDWCILVALVRLSWVSASTSKTQQTPLTSAV